MLAGPAHALAVDDTAYTTESCAIPVLDKVIVPNVGPLPADRYPVMFPNETNVHEYDAFAVKEDQFTDVVVFPLQTDWLKGLLLIEASGFTVISTLNGNPGQLPAAPDVGVTTYVIVIGANVVLNKVPLIVVSFVPDAAPLIPTGSVGADQLYTVALGTIVFELG